MKRRRKLRELKLCLVILIAMTTIDDVSTPVLSTTRKWLKKWKVGEDPRSAADEAVRSLTAAKTHCKKHNGLLGMTWMRYLTTAWMAGQKLLGNDATTASMYAFTQPQRGTATPTPTCAQGQLQTSNVTRQGTIIRHETLNTSTTCNSVYDVNPPLNAIAFCVIRNSILMINGRRLGNLLMFS